MTNTERSTNWQIYYGCISCDLDKFWRSEKPAELFIRLKIAVWISRNIQLKNGTAISRISRKEHNLARYTEILRNMLAGISVSFVFTPGNFRNFRLNGSLIANPTVTGFSGNFPRTYIYLPYVQVSKFSEFLVYLVNHWKVNRGPRYLHINFYNFLQQ